MAVNKDERIVFAVGKGPDGKPVLLLGIPTGAWEYMKDGKTHTFDLARLGLPLQMMIFGTTSHAAGRKIIEDYNAGRVVDLTDESFGIKPPMEE